MAPWGWLWCRVPACPSVSRETLSAAGLVGSVKKPVKLLGDGDVERAFTVSVDAISGSARKKVEAAGGSVVIADDEEKA